MCSLSWKRLDAYCSRPVVITKVTDLENVFQKTEVRNSTSVTFPSDNQWALMWDWKSFMVMLQVAMNCNYCKDYKSLVLITWISRILSCSPMCKSEWNFLAIVTCPLVYRSLTNDAMSEFYVWPSLKPCCGAISCTPRQSLQWWSHLPAGLKSLFVCLFFS